MSYQIPLTHEQVAARLSMPKTPEGYVMSLLYVPPRAAYRAAYELAWREWLSKHPRHLWPNWVEQFAARIKTARQGEEPA